MDPAFTSRERRPAPDWGSLSLCKISPTSSRLLNSSIQQRSAELQFSMASEPLVGAMLRTLAASKPGGRFLELGTGTGIATAWLLEGMDAGSTLISVDNDRAAQQVASDCLGADPRLTLVTSGGLESARSTRRELRFRLRRCHAWKIRGALGCAGGSESGRLLRD